MRLQVIELIHRDPHKSVPLYVQTTTAPERERWKAYAERFKLPALVEADANPADMVGDCAAVRAIEHGALAGANPADFRPPPDKLSVEPDTIDGDLARRVTVPPSGLSLIRITSIILLLGGWPYVLLVPMWLWRGEIVWPFPYEILLFLAGVAALSWCLLAIACRIRKRAVVVGRNCLIVEDEAEKGTSRVRTFQFEVLEEVQVKNPYNGERCLLIADHNRETEFGEGLSEEALTWLRDYILAAVARA